MRRICLFIFITILLFTTAPIVSATPSKKFTDTKGHWAEENITWAVDGEIINGYADGTFKPNRNVTEAEFLVMLLRAFHAALPEVTIQSHWADGVTFEGDEAIAYILGKRYASGT